MMISTRELVLIAIFVLATNFASSQPEESTTQRYCGRNLVNVLTLVCDGIYNHMALQGHDSYAKSDPSQRSDSPVFREKRSVASIFKGRSQRRLRRGAYEECCRKGCTIEEMVGYCGGSS